MKSHSKTRSVRLPTCRVVGKNRRAGSCRACKRIFIVAAALLAVASDGNAGDRPYGLGPRVPWTSSKIQGSPDPPSPFRVELAFSKLKFDEPVVITRGPGTERFYVVQRFGKIYSFVNSPDTETADLMLEVGKSAYGLAFHPRFSENKFVYVTYVIDPREEMPRGTRVSRFQMTQDDPPRCAPDSEEVVIEWPSGGHNGGCLKFGPDGYLYIATGDSSGINDEYLTGQDVGSLSGSILRIDVDNPHPGKSYGIPGDNPFVGVDGALPEIWAYGLRQPWKMNFDPRTGDLWCGNIGQDLWEQVLLIERGGNYGWSITEGSHPFRPERERGPTPILLPIVEHDHTEFRSVTGGYVYHGTRLPELNGAYIYGDYDTGKVWALRYDGKQVAEHRELVDSSVRVIGFAEDHEGELYFADHITGRIHQLAPNSEKDRSSDFPRRLSETGLFASVPEHIPASGVIPYSINAPMWNDGAHVERFLAVPGTAKIEFDGIIYPQPAPGAPHGWKFPDGTVAVQTFSLDTKQGNPSSRRRLETRILHHERVSGTSEVGDQLWHGYTYVWNEDQTDAVLLEDRHGRDKSFWVNDENASGGGRRHTWHFPARSECSVCHNIASKYAIGINTRQLNRDHNYDGVTVNQLTAWDHTGLFTESLPALPDELPRVADYRNESHDLGRRARAYLHANCAHCHRKWGGGNASFRLYSNLKLDEMGIVDVRPAHGTFSTPDARILAPGDPQRSVLLYRIATLGPGRMPRLGSTVVDEQGLQLIYDWIRRLDSRDGPLSDESIRLRSLTAEAIDQLLEGSDDQSMTAIDTLLGSTSGAIRLLHVVRDDSLSDRLRKAVISKATVYPQLHIRDLFERFLPEEGRTKRLGNVVRPDKILAIDGNIAQGKQVFFATEGIQCKNCHQIGGKGTQVGPDLSKIGKKYDRRQILESILEPSKQIDPKFVTYLVETDEGQLHSGLLVEQNDTKVVLKDAQNKLVHISTADVDLMTTQQKSLMPDLLLRDMTARQVADLTAYLSSLK